jgi:hypothetical protein
VDPLLLIAYVEMPFIADRPADPNVVSECGVAFEVPATWTTGWPRESPDGTCWLRVGPPEDSPTPLDPKILDPPQAPPNKRYLDSSVKRGVIAEP